MTDWSQIVQQHGPMVWQTVYRLLNHDADAADCFQNAFVSAWQLSQRESIQHWPALLRRLATVRAVERLRQRYRDRKRQTRLEEAVAIAANDPQPPDAVESAELAERLRRAVAELKPRQAEVFCLACLDGLSYQDIAAQLRISVNHVGVLLNRARRSLHRRLQAHVSAAGSPFMQEGSS